ncbi:MAG: hypothetical protein J6J38_07480 [Lachnospiraceae bacterium]|nr:hypothetical protein [Lachnospiraceae bacterium]
MEQNASATSVIGKPDGATSVCLIKRDAKLTWKQKLQKFRYQIKRAYVERTLKPGAHTMDEVMEYIVNVHGFTKLGFDEIKEEYNEMRASFLIQHAPELLGEYATLPKLKSESREDLLEYVRQAQERTEKAKEIPATEFDIDFHKFQISFEDINDNIHFLIEKRFGYIGGGASGNKKILKRFHRIYKDIYRYYGVTEEDIKNKTKRYEEVVRTLCRKH